MPSGTGESREVWVMGKDPGDSRAQRWSQSGRDQERLRDRGVQREGDELGARQDQKMEGRRVEKGRDEGEDWSLRGRQS